MAGNIIETGYLAVIVTQSIPIEGRIMSPRLSNAGNADDNCGKLFGETFGSLIALVQQRQESVAVVHLPAPPQFNRESLTGGFIRSDLCSCHCLARSI
jgi:hypothetical protein